MSFLKSAYNWAEVRLGIKELVEKRLTSRALMAGRWAVYLLRKTYD